MRQPTLRRQAEQRRLRGRHGGGACGNEKSAEVFKTCDRGLRVDPPNVVALGVRAAWLLDGVDRAQSADREGDLRRAEKDVTTLLAVNAGCTPRAFGQP